ncbi:MAG TPA: type 1 glutamine amidotransferase family protein [Polyangiales bacterium]|nr:type 1 glutamine amidotransferase family protein [Polyangiales bacterium]
MQTREVHVYVFDTLADWEVGHAIAQINSRDYQKRPGRYRIRTVGPTRDPVTTIGGMRILPDMPLAELRPEQSAMFILPGGTSWEHGGEAAAIDKVQQLRAAEVPIAAICGATGALARAGMLDHCAHTSNARAYLEPQPGYRGADHYRDNELAVSDRGLITASSMAPLEFARQIFLMLDLYTPQVLGAWYGLHATGEGRFYHELMQADAAQRKRDVT